MTVLLTQSEVLRAPDQGVLQGPARALDLVGNTPLLDLSHLTGRPRLRLFAKAEFANPGGSVKDRPALAMVQDAERRGLFAGGRRLLDALVDVPLALPTAVAGIALTGIWAGNGWLGRYAEPQGLKVAFAPAGVLLALVFVGLPFVVRSLQPVLEELDPELEEAASSLGATRAQVFSRVLLPHLVPAWITGFSLAFARGLGEYGSVVFISGNMPMKTEIVPLLIITKLEQYDYAGATAVALVMLMVSFVLLLGVNLLQWAARRRMAV
jgi:sulfate ABC transporter permease protein CysT